MNFTLIFHDPDGSNSFDLQWVPCLCFKVGGEIVFNTSKDRVDSSNHPEYVSGDFAAFYKKVFITPPQGRNKKATIVVHPGGYGSEKDLESLTREMKENGFLVEIYYTRGIDINSESLALI